MLVLTRRVGKEIVIDDDICVTVVAVHGDKVRLGIVAPAGIRVDRKEIHAKRELWARQSFEEVAGGAMFAPVPHRKTPL